MIDFATEDTEQAPEGDANPLEGMARVLTSSVHYKVLRRFAPRTHYASPTPEADVKRGLVVDVETTGTNAREDAIIELALLPFVFDRALGVVLSVGEPVSFLEDPGVPIPDAVVDLTGITDEMVAGQRIDDAVAARMLEEADLVIAHNARFDRPFVEKRLPAAASRAWACSMSEVAWKEHGNPSNALGALLITHAGEFLAEEGDAQAHRAATDCAMTLHCLASPLGDGSLPFTHLLTSARRRTVRVWAIGAPFDAKAQLKSRGYSWNGGEDGRPKAWSIEVPAERAVEEREWLEARVYEGMAPAHRSEAVSAFSRYSARA